jgi:hypothetical protein
MKGNVSGIRQTESMISVSHLNMLLYWEDAQSHEAPEYYREIEETPLVGR